MVKAKFKNLFNSIKFFLFRNKQSVIRSAKLNAAYREIAFQNLEKERRANELVDTFVELKTTKVHLQKHIDGLEEMMFMISHRLRQPITHILGVAAQLTNAVNSPEELKVLVDYMQKSALDLDMYTRELSLYITSLARKRKGNLF